MTSQVRRLSGSVGSSRFEGFYRSRKGKVMPARRMKQVAVQKDPAGKQYACDDDFVVDLSFTVESDHSIIVASILFSRRIAFLITATCFILLAGMTFLSYTG